ncbi:hypothetical protein CTA2_2871 [Colletotrichum tanaceti]|uniref:Uncharacterized protein n=1 Tax=Colletotrichum tanaceti TaxID=1306861 RepID=A0A4U6XVN7_9PEZI|nr:hypothetical protein CTA2_2871 [Colletotrichum tanaceti]TKW60105.1 hypothetical protein CTA1_4777 [Colletotrichum tanaceti]
MRPPPLSRLYTTAVLTKVRRIPVHWEAPSQDYEHRPFEAVPDAQKLPSLVPKLNVIDRSSASHQRPVFSTPHAALHTSSHQFLLDALEYLRAPSGPFSESKIESLMLFAQEDRDDHCTVSVQYLLKRALGLDPRLACVLWSDFKWKQISRRLASNGTSADDLSHWAWILLENQPDERVTKFLSRPCHKPRFLLFYILGGSLSSPKSLTRLLEYCREWYSGQETVDQPGEHSRVFRAMTPTMFSRVIKRLCRQASLVQPGAMPDIANLAVSYIQGIPCSRQVQEKVYMFQCGVFNDAIQAVSYLSKVSPYEHSSSNWIAIRTLLSMSNRLAQPLIIERNSYRAIRHVLLALPKTDSERDTASTLSSSWPPYRVSRDGMEEKADTEDYLSRAVQVGFMMQAGGYGKIELDSIMDILGGMAPDGSPTIQTRANYPLHLKVPQGTWAAMIRTTRNAQEAWALFNHPPEPGATPTPDVYLELMQKIAAKPANPAHNNLPGDGREVFPFDETNLSDYEKARLLPPSIPELLQEMFNAGVRLEGRMLAWLIGNQSSSFETALEYIDHSDLDEKAKHELRWCIEEYQRPSSDLPETPPLTSNNLPRGVARVIIALACHLQPHHPTGSPHFIPGKNINSIHYAIRLAGTLWSSKNASNLGPAPWGLILKALSRPNIVVSPRENSFELIRLAFKVLEKVEARDVFNFNLFCSFAHVIRNTVWAKLPFLLDPPVRIPVADKEFMSLYKARGPKLMIPEGPRVFRDPDLADDETVGSWDEILTPIFKNSQSGVAKHRTHYEIIQEASTKLKALWRKLATKGPASRAYANSWVKATHINSYMRTLAAVGDVEEMVLLLCWVVRDWAPYAGRHLSREAAERLHGALCAFRAFAEPLLDESTVVSLRKEVDMHRKEGGSVSWPNHGDIEAYTARNSAWGNHLNLCEVIRMVASKRERQMQRDEIERMIRMKMK